MLITLKTLQQQSFMIEIDPGEPVSALKKKVEDEKGSDYPAAGQKLIYAGKILDDAKLISEYNIDEKNFVVVMVTKPKASAASKPAESAQTSAAAAAPPAAAAPSPVAAQKPAETKDEKKEEEKPKGPASESESNTSASSAGVTPTTVTTGASSSSSDMSVVAESTLVTGENYERVIQEMMEMGFDRPQVERAMQASFNNPDRAVEYLMSGIPDITPPTPEQGEEQAPATVPAPASGGSMPAPTPGSDQAQDPLEFLRNQPQFLQMRQLVQSNPALLPSLLQQLGQSNPELLQLISSNQERFIALLNDPIAGAGGQQAPSDQQAPTGQQNPTIGGMPSGGPPGQGVSYIQVTPEEREAIDRLKALGFPESMVIQAYFACEKNENLAANFLLSQGFDDD